MSFRSREDDSGRLRVGRTTAPYRAPAAVERRPAAPGAARHLLATKAIGPRSLTDYAARRADEMISGPMTRQQALVLLCHVAEIPEAHATPHAEKHAASADVDLDRFFADIGLQHDHPAAQGIARGARHLKARMTPDELTAMVVDQLGLASDAVRRGGFSEESTALQGHAGLAETRDAGSHANLGRSGLDTSDKRSK